MHYRGTVGKRHFHSNGDFTEGFLFCEPKGDSEWIDLTEIFPLVKKAVQTGRISGWELTGEGGTKYQLSKKECEIVVSAYLEEVFGYLQGCSALEMLTLLKDKNIGELLTVSLTKGQIRQLKSKKVL